jgi:hypothetical protein
MDMYVLESEVKVLILDHEIYEDWVRIQEWESHEIQDEDEEFVNSLDPESTRGQESPCSCDKNKDVFVRFILTFRW